MRANTQASLLIAALAVGCADETGPLTQDAGPLPLEFCPASASSLTPDGDLISVEVRCPYGSVCGIGTGILYCFADGSQQELGGGLLLSTLEREVAHNPAFPRCTQNSQCDPSGGGLCLFEPGCEAPEGSCCPYAVCQTDEAGLRFLVEHDCPDCLTYCGCDGVTYNDVPTRPYAYPGPCL